MQKNELVEIRTTVRARVREGKQWSVRLGVNLRISSRVQSGGYACDSE